MSQQTNQTKIIDNSHYLPDVVNRLLIRLNKEKFSRIALYGFSANMRWLFRILSEQGFDPILCDWRNDRIGWDCGGKTVMSIDDLNNDSNILLVICIEESALLKECVRYIMEKNLSKMPVIYERGFLSHNLFLEEKPYSTIREAAKARAISMISNEQLFDLIQLIKNTKDIPGDVLEFGSLYGGSGAILVEAVKHFTNSSKNVYLFDTFGGIPKSKYGLDYRWRGAFSDNSYAEVANAFSDCNNVKVIQGNIIETYSQFKGKISFGYLASDTYETGKVLLDFIWSNLSVGGILAVCDYGSYPNCIPLTVLCDKFFEDKTNARIFYANKVGLYATKIV